MLKWIVVAALITAGFTLNACAPKTPSAQDADGYVQNVYGERISWKGAVPITLYIHESADPYRAAIESAAKTWEAAAGHKLFNIVATKLTGPILPAKDGMSVIYLMNTWEPELISQQARTSVYWVGDQIQEADMRINAKFSFYWNQAPSTLQAVNIEALVLHEMGHILGLKHRDDDPSVMATYLSSNTNRTNLYPDDINSLKLEY